MGGIWEQRWHPLREEWVIVAAHRQNRPWSGEMSENDVRSGPSYDPGCYLCPGNPRVGGVVNDRYESVFVFDNDLPCVGSDAPTEIEPAPGIYRNRPATGVARVICYDPNHSLTLPEMPVGAVEKVVATWRAQYRELGALPEVNHVLIFENKGEAVGVSNPHPHGQIYATNFVFKTTEIEVGASDRYFRETGRGLFEDIIRSEMDDQRRIIFENATAIVFMPYFARYAYEVFIAPKRRVPSIDKLTDAESADLAEALHAMTIKFDNLWHMSFPYVMPLRNAPTDGGDYGFYHFYIQFLPPLRKPNLLKYLAGPEIGGGNFLSDTSPEEKARELQSLPLVHYKQEAR
ncbi:MAG TPA: galactose-1-phosphate uridylyltransferase [Pyrinomonadaceae bacterium]|nr:galactose-1-phosphate uridylyltransferase [Pyrinomonadaceae bacterium]